MKQARQRSLIIIKKPNKRSEALLIMSILENGQKPKSSPRIKVVQKLYNSLIDPEAIIEYLKSQYKKFIKDVVTFIERSELAKKDKFLLATDINLDKTDKLLKIILFAAIYELMFKHNMKKVIINEYLATQNFLKIQIGYLNAILDKISKELRKDE